METPTPEEWRDLPGWVGLYQVSSRGRVRTVPRTVARGAITQYRIRRKILRQAVGGRAKNYRRVRLHAGRSIHAYVHHLVALAWHGERPIGHVVCHVNDVGHDNRAENLYYGTPADNLRDRWGAPDPAPILDITDDELPF